MVTKFIFISHKFTCTIKLAETPQCRRIDKHPLTESGLLSCLVCVADDHSRVKLKSEVNVAKKDYINASFIVRTLQTIRRALIFLQLVGTGEGWSLRRLVDNLPTTHTHKHSQVHPVFTVLLLAPCQSLLSRFFFSSSSTPSLITTLVSRLTSPPRDPWLTLWLISGRSAHHSSLLFLQSWTHLKKVLN